MILNRLTSKDFVHVKLMQNGKNNHKHSKDDYSFFQTNIEKYRLVTLKATKESQTHTLVKVEEKASMVE